MKTKLCRICGIPKDIDDFILCKNMKDGHRNECKSCSNLKYNNKERRRELNLEKDIKIDGEKICRLCNDKKSIKEFHLKRGTPDGHRNECKECVKGIQKIYKEAPGFKEKQVQYDKFRYVEIKDIVIERTRKRYRNNRSDILMKKKIYREKAENKKRQKEWWNNHKDMFVVYQNVYKQKYPHVIAWRSILHSTLNRLGSKKECHTVDMLGYSAIELKEHLEKQFTKGMNWNNYGDWNIDHHMPVTFFPKGTDVKIVCALSNLKPMWATTRVIDGITYEGNLNKGDKIPV